VIGKTLFKHSGADTHRVHVCAEPTLRRSVDTGFVKPVKGTRKNIGQACGETCAAIGFTVKSGWACAVLLVGSAESPQVVESRRVDLNDPAVPESRQPYHAGFGTAREAGPELSRLISAVRRFGQRSVTGLVRHYQAFGHPVRGAGIVVGSLIDPERIANDHIRIHALEGQLFRRVVYDAATRSKLSCSIWRERDLYALASGILKQPERELRGKLAVLGRELGGPWRAEQKAAALAAWLVLAGHRSRWKEPECAQSK
jgi:hypothetical protein